MISPVHYFFGGSLVDIDVNCIISISSWSTDLQSSGIASTPTCSVELTLDAIPAAVDITAVRFLICDWGFRVTSVQRDRTKIKLEMQSDIALQESATYTGNYLAVDARSVFNSISGADNLPGGYFAPGYDLSKGTIYPTTNHGWLGHWTFTCDDALANAYLTAATSHSITLMTASMLNPVEGSFYSPLATTMFAIWTVTWYQSSWESSAVSMRPEDSDQLLYHSLDAGADYYDNIHDLTGKVGDDVWSSVIYAKNSADFEVEFTDGTKGTLHATFDGSAPLWDSVRETDLAATHVISGRMANCTSTNVWTGADAASYLATHGKILVPGRYKHCADIWIGDVSTQMTLNHENVVSCNKSNTNYNFLNNQSGLKLKINGKASSATVNIGSPTDESLSYDCKYLGAPLQCRPAVFAAGTGPWGSGTTRDYIMVGYTSTLYDPSYAGHLWWFGNAKGMFKATFINSDEATTVGRAVDETGTSREVGLYTLLLLPSGYNPNQVESIIKEGPVYCLQDIPDLFASRNRTFEAEAWEIAVPYTDGYSLKVGDQVTIDLDDYFLNKINAMIAGLTVDWANNKIDLRVVPYETTSASTATDLHYDIATRPLKPNKPVPVLSGDEFTKPYLANVSYGCKYYAPSTGRITWSSVDESKGFGVRYQGVDYFTGECLLRPTKEVLSQANGFVNSTVGISTRQSGYELQLPGFKVYFQRFITGAVYIPDAYYDDFLAGVDAIYYNATYI